MDEQRIPPRPLLSKIVARLLNPLNKFFDWIYHSEYNPFYRSGTLAIGLLFVLLASGFYLLFFYRVGAPYASVAAIQEQVWLGRWIRALHRYATDAALIAVFFHVLQLLSHGKTWGPRTLAWVSGMILLASLCISAWTGYVMVWDEHGQFVALAGLELLQAIPLLKNEVSSAFNGERALPASFFFMNLFLHVAIPLGMVFGMWIHTARLARTIWFPIKSVFLYCLIGLTILSIALPAVLLPEANMLRIIGRIQIDWWYGFWIPLIYKSSPEFVLLVLAGLFTAGITIPWWWRPSTKKKPAISEVDEELCTGCTQCARDCPYDAIKMIPHSSGKHLLAEVSPLHCVSCGICAASCDELAVGPPGRSAGDQHKNIDLFCDETIKTAEKEAIVIVACRHNESVPEKLSAYADNNKDIYYFDLNCCGTLQSAALEKLLARVGGVILSGCAARNCMNRDGLDLLKGRLYGKRVPFISRDIDQKRIVVAPNSENEVAETIGKVKSLQHYLATGEQLHNKKTLNKSKISWFAKRTIASATLISAMGFINQAPYGEEVTYAQLRIVGSIPGQVKNNCRPLTEKEKSKTPLHMQKKEICEASSVSYRLNVILNQKVILEKELKSRSIRGELSTMVSEDIKVNAGQHQLEVKVSPTVENKNATAFGAKHSFKLHNGEIKIVELQRQ